MESNALMTLLEPLRVGRRVTGGFNRLGTDSGSNLLVARHQSRDSSPEPQPPNMRCFSRYSLTMEEVMKPSIVTRSSSALQDDDDDDDVPHGWKCLMDCGMFGSLLPCFMSQWVIHRR